MPPPAEQPPLRAGGHQVTTAYEIDLHRQLGPLALNVHFTLTAPWTVLFAPSGAGKSTLLRIIAGLDRPDQGRILCASQWPDQPRRELVLTDTASRTFVPTHRRHIRMLAQKPALFPHLSVLDNVRFGAAKSTRQPQARSLDEILELCRATHFRNKKPAQLSGGETQRIVLARSLASPGFHLFLLDEPFTGLEADLRNAIIADLRAYLARLGVLVLQVTHDIGEVFAAEAEVLRMEDGRIVAQGSAAEVLTRERQTLLDRLQP